MKFQIEQISSHYKVKIFTDNDIADIYSICKENLIYYRYMKIEPTLENITEVITALPPNITMDNKFFLGLYNGNQLIAILDLITGYPNVDTAHIGWFMMNKDFQGIGIGTEIISEMLSFLKEENYRYVQLGYIKGNQEAEIFWKKNKFIPNGIQSETDDYTIVVMQREV